MELINKINETFKVNIMSDKRTYDVLWFRYYIANLLKDEEIEAVAEILNRSVKQVYRIRQLLPELIEKQEFKDISKIVETMDVYLYERFLIKNYVYSGVKEKKVKKMPLAEVMKLLRKNMKSPLWNIEIANWSYKDWEILKGY